MSAARISIPRRTREKPGPLRAVDRRHLSARALTVRDETFRRHDFFDADDVVQVKYEMLRRHRIDGIPVSQVAALFGVSRQTFYAVARAFDREGLSGLWPGKPGPRNAWKCTNALITFAERCRLRDPDISMAELLSVIARRFGVILHSNTLGKALGKTRTPTLARSRTAA